MLARIRPSLWRRPARACPNRAEGLTEPVMQGPVDGGPTIRDMAPRVPTGSASEPHERAALLTGEQVSAINRFPDDNPNPVMRIDADGHLIYANPASAGVLKALGVAVGDRLPAESARPVRGRRAGTRLRRVRRGQPDLRRLARPDPRPGLHEPLRHGRDGRAGDREVPGPEPEPGPPDRLGRHASSTPTRRAPASSPASAWRSGRASRSTSAMRSWSASGLPTATTVEVEAGGRTYALLPVDVPEFGFVNVYGTDVTAVRERERLAARERAAAAQHPARADRPAPARRRAAHRRPLRRRHAAVRRHRRVHPPVVDDVPVRARRRPQRRLHGLRRARRALRPREGEDDRRRLHGRRRHDRAVRRPHGPGRRHGPRPGRRGRPDRGGGPARHPLPDRHPLRPGGGRRDRHARSSSTTSGATR